MTTEITSYAPVVISLPGGLPALITDAGECMSRRFVAFFTVILCNPHSPRQNYLYLRAELTRPCLCEAERALESHR
jgi:hypothetical protein